MVRRLWCALFALYVVATAVHIGVVMAHEPFAFDAWNMAVDTRGEPFSLSRFFAYGIYEYTHSNPRIGQWLTYLAYKLEYFASIATPLAYLGLAGAVAVLGLGRWPGGAQAVFPGDVPVPSRPAEPADSPHRASRRANASDDGAPRRTPGRDLALCAIALGFLWFAIPRIGMIMFCRAYGANYLYGAVIQLWFLVPLRLAPEGIVRRRAWLAYGVLGVIAGMCNEHTGPVLVGTMVGYAVWRWRRLGRHAPLAWAGAAGSLIGFAAIFFAPGQASRYDGLATKISLLGRLLQRGVTGNLDIFRDWMLGIAPVLGLVVIAVILARKQLDRVEPALRLLGGALIAGSLITATVFVSPKLGPRFYLLGSALVLAGFLAIADRALPSIRRLAPFVVLAVAASIYAGVRSLPLYLRLAEASDDRLAALAAAPRGSVFTAASFEQVDDSWWFLGDDFRDVKKRELVARYLDLRGVIFRAVDIDAPLGVSDVRLVPRYQVTPASCLDEHGGLELGTFRGIDIAAVHKAAEAAIERAAANVARVGRLDQLDLVVEFAGDPPPLPRPTLVVGRWRAGRYQGHIGAIARQGLSRTRRVVVPRELATAELEIYAYQVNGEARRLGTGQDLALDYVPWKRGAYWALACGATECFVIASTRVL